MDFGSITFASLRRSGRPRSPRRAWALRSRGRRARHRARPAPVAAGRGPRPPTALGLAPCRSPRPVARTPRQRLDRAAPRSGSSCSTARWGPRSSATAPTRRGYRGERFADWPTRRAGQQRPAQHHRSPRSSPAIHREYLDAGADLIETNTFNANAHLAGRLRHAGPRLRAQRGRGRGSPARVRLRRPARTPDRPRYVVGALGPTSRTASISPDVNDPGARNVTYDELVDGLPGAGRRAGRRRRRRAADRDDLRHAQRQGGDLRAGDAVRGARPPLAGDDLRHHHRRLRAHALRPGHRGVLALGAARPAAARRPQLRARRQGDAALRRRALPHRRHLRLLLSERRPAQRVRRVRRDARADRRGARRVRRQRLRQPRRRLLRHHPGAHRARSPAPSTGRSPRTPAQPRPGAAAVRPRAADGHRGQPVRQRRRADEHHRLGPLPQPDQGRRLPGGARRRPAAGRGRRAGHRHQHGRGDDRRRRGDGPLHRS